MPIQKFTRGDGKVLLHPDEQGGGGGGQNSKKRAIELNDYTKMMGGSRSNSLIRDEFDDHDNEAGDYDELEREFGSDAADVIRHHLNSFHHRINFAKSKNTSDGERDISSGSYSYSPLDEIEERFRTIDRITAAKGSTQDLALLRRARTESRDYFRLGSLSSGSSGDHEDGLEEVLRTGDDDATDFDKEFGHGRGYDATSVFGKGSTVKFPYGRDLPSPTYHPDFPTGSNVGNNPNDSEEEAWVQELNKLIYEEKYTDMELGDIDETYKPSGIQKEDMDKYMAEKERTKKFNLLEREEEHEKAREEKLDELLEMIKNGEDPNQEAFGPWYVVTLRDVALLSFLFPYINASIDNCPLHYHFHAKQRGDMTVKVDRVQKVERGGTTVRYRALVIGGNGNGAAGFGIGKALSPNEAIAKACKHCKRNVFYIDRYLNSGLSYDLAGRHNSCKVRLRAVSPDYGLHGHPLITEILKYAGISDATSKSHGNRNPYNVVYATFKALMTHESLEEIAMKRGKKLLNLQRARRLGI